MHHTCIGWIQIFFLKTVKFGSHYQSSADAIIFNSGKLSNSFPLIIVSLSRNKMHLRSLLQYSLTYLYPENVFRNHILAKAFECSMKACQCDTQLVYKMSAIFESKSDIFDLTKTYKSGYNPYTQCRKARTTSDKKADKCCGDETNRYPFYSMRGQKACCKSR